MAPVLSAMGATVAAMTRRYHCGSALEIDVHASCVLLGHVLQPEFLAHLLDTGFDLLDVVDGVVSLANDTMRQLAKLLFGTPMQTRKSKEEPRC